MPPCTAAAKVTTVRVHPLGVTFVTFPPREGNKGNSGNAGALYARGVTLRLSPGKVSGLCGHVTSGTGGRHHDA